MVRFLVAALCFSALYMGAQAGVDCTDKDDGAYGWGCKAYTYCTGGKGRQVFCDGERVFNPEIEECDDPENVGPPCGLIRDCTRLPDGSYADLKLYCTSYFTCRDGRYWGHHVCAPGLVFDNEEGVCKWKWDVVPPCGTKDPDAEDDDDDFY